MIDINEVFSNGIMRGASDIHLKSGVPPIFRVNGKLISMDNANALSREDAFSIIDFFAKDNEKLKEAFESDRRLDINYEISDTRLRVNVSLSDGVPILTARIVRKSLPSFSSLGLPEIVMRNALLPQGLILVTGKSNSGKSTTLNAIVNEINQTENKKILMLENPIEYMHTSKNSLIIQKEVGLGKDCNSFSDGAINALR